MKGAAVKDARLSQGLDAAPRARRRSGVEHVGPTTAIDAVLAGHPVGFGRQLWTEIGLVVGIMAVMTLILVVMLRGEGQRLVSEASIQMLVIMGGTTVAMVVILGLRRWHQSRMISIRLSREERQCVSATGSLRIQARNVGLGTQQCWLLARGSDWMAMDAEMLEALEGLMVERPKIDGPFDLQTGTDVTKEWTIPGATILFHPASDTIIEVEDQYGRLAYRHPRYRPNG